VGLKLKTQIAGILFLLFTLTVGIIGYFNMSLLYEAMRTLSEEQSTGVAAGIVDQVARRLPADGYNEAWLRAHLGENNE